MVDVFKTCATKKRKKRNKGRNKNKKKFLKNFPKWCSELLLCLKICLKRRQKHSKASLANKSTQTSTVAPSGFTSPNDFSSEDEVKVEVTVEEVEEAEISDWAIL